MRCLWIGSSVGSKAIKDPIHHRGLRIALAAFRTSPAHGLYVEAHEPSLASRRPELALNYF